MANRNNNNRNNRNDSNDNNNRNDEHWFSRSNQDEEPQIVAERFANWGRERERNSRRTRNNRVNYANQDNSRDEPAYDPNWSRENDLVFIPPAPRRRSDYLAIHNDIYHPTREEAERAREDYHRQTNFTINISRERLSRDSERLLGARTYCESCRAYMANATTPVERRACGHDICERCFRSYCRNCQLRR